jgi:hypothetical protein
MNTPVLDLPWNYQHAHQLRTYLQTRDLYSDPHCDKWSTTALEFAAAVHPLPPKCERSYWHAARRSLIMYDWMGHGRNRSKRHLSPTSEPVCCPHCNGVDDQQHIMLDCPHLDLIPLRKTAMEQQHRNALALKLQFKAPTIHYFIEQFVHASWTTPSLHTRRIWLGLWNPSTLQSLLHPTIQLTSPMTMMERLTYRHIVKTLTIPLLSAYRHMIQVQVQHHSLAPTPAFAQTTLKTTRHMRLLFHHNTPTTVLPCLPAPCMTASTSTFTYSDAAFGLTDADIGILHDPIIY